MDSYTFQDAINALEKLGCKPKLAQNGIEYHALCPCHDDKTPSLSIKAGDKVPVIAKCFAGCNSKDILKKMGSVPENPHPSGKAKIVAVYSYRDAQGHEVYQSVRYEPKTFRQRRPNGKGGWVWKGPENGTHVLYRLPELLEAIPQRQTVFIVEGEKDADRLAALELTTTTNIGGADKWKPEYTQQLTGADRVILIPDNDEPGRIHMRKIAQQLDGKVSDVRWLELPDLPEKGDVSDWLNQGHTRDDLLALTQDAPPAVNLTKTKIPPDLTKNRRNNRNSRNNDNIYDVNHNDIEKVKTGTAEFETGTTGTNNEETGTTRGMHPYFFMKKADGTLISTRQDLAEEQEIDGPGLYYVPVVETKIPKEEGRGTIAVSEYGSPVWICISFDLLATTDDGQGHGHGIALRFEALHGHIHTWTLPRGLLVIEGRELFQKLYDMGFHMALSDGSFHKLRTYLNRARTEAPDMPKALSIARTGWAPGRRFVLPDQVFGSNGVEIFFQSDDPRPSPYTLTGTLEGWRDGVSKPLAEHDVPVFSISCAFAGPLLEPLRIESGGFHFEGLTSTGKTSVQRFALSVWGNSRELLQTWNGTRVGVELVTAAYSDTLLVLDEIGQADPKAVGEIVYLICNENGRTRGNVRLTHRANLRWRTLLLSSGEKSLAQVMAGAGGFPPAAGQETRLAHIPVDVDGAGVFTGLMDPAMRKVILAQITQASRQHHGHAARRFLEHLTSEKSLDDWDEYAAIVRDMAAKLAGPESTNEIDRVALRFALVGFAGEFATRCGITGWKNGRAIEASTALFKRWKAHWGSASRDETLFLLRADEWLSEHMTGSFIEVDAKAPNETKRLPVIKPFYGFTTVENEQRTFYVNAAGWKDLTRQTGRGVAVSALKRTKRLVEGGDGDGGKKLRISGELGRFYVIQGVR